MQPAENRRPSAKRIVLLIVTGLMLAFIFGQSLLPKNASAEESGWLTEKVLNPVLDLFGIQPLTRQATRKIAHVTEFAILSVLLAFCFRGRIIKSAGVGFTAAFLDETIQLFSDRGALISDVWIDLIGVALGSLAGYLIGRAILRSHRTQRKIERKEQTDAP